MKHILLVVILIMVASDLSYAQAPLAEGARIRIRQSSKAVFGVPAGLVLGSLVKVERWEKVGQQP